MSQFYQGVTTGVLPPVVATSYVTDDGTAIPATSVLNVNGLDTIEDNANGILTRANPDLSNNLEILLTNRISVTATTSDGGSQTQTVTLITPANASSISFKCAFIGYDAANDEAAGGSQEGIARKSAGVAVIVGINDSSDQSDAGLAAVDWNVISSGANLSAEFVGIAGRTITWTATFIYSQTPQTP